IVTPGQLPTYWVLPVNSLNIEVLPEFGFPTRAIVRFIRISVSLADANLLMYQYLTGFRFSQCEFVPSHSDFNRIAQWSYLLYSNGCSLGDSHFHDSSHS